MVDDTVADTLAPVAQAPDPRAPLPGYELGTLIGQGGMGEVVLARDPKIDREVAIKRMKRTSLTPDATDRFLREAKIQARLDHPAIVPVHDLGHDSEGRPYFTMERIEGTTMVEAIQLGGQQQRLVRAFVDVCLAIDLAHTRHIVHRDLKPANIMLGDYGEVYVIDWGIARLLEEAADGIDTSITVREQQRHPGAVLGTPGYMAPEQAEGEPCAPATDVYALGCILFEILVGAPLHPSGLAGLDSAIDAPTVAPSSRAPNVPPELDAACVAALSRDPVARPTARQLGERIQRYLDGDRDRGYRRELAIELLAQATATTGQADQMRLAGRALALDPESKEAAALVTRLMLEPPDEIPPELARSIVRSELEDEWRSGGIALVGLASTFGFLPVVLWMGVTNVPLFAGILAVLASMIAITYLQRRALKAGRRFNLYPSLVGSTVLAAMISRLFGPFVLVPLVVMVIALAMTAQPQMQRRPAAVLAICCLGFVAPLVLEKAGVLASTWQVQDGIIALYSMVVRLGGMATKALLIVGTLAGIIVAALFSRGLAISRRDAIQQLHLQRWRFMQLVPDSVRRRQQSKDRW
jgi:serine/threonine-protein kinase